jgi:hypothetical protein
MICYYVNALERTINETEYSHGKLHQLLPGGITSAQRFRNGDILYVDDEGLLRPATRAFRLARGRLDGQPMMSDGLLVGAEAPQDFYYERPPAMTIAQLQAEIEWLTIEEALDWFRVRVREAAVTRREGGGPDVVIADWSSFLRNLEGKSGGFQPGDVWR